MGEGERKLRVPLPTRRATRRLARALAAVLRPGDLVVLEGGLGAGKTFLVRGLARELGVPTSVKVTSPTFGLVHELPGRALIIHADLYRLGSVDELAELGLREHLRSDAVVLIEWGRRFLETLGGDGLLIELARDGDQRSATIEALGPRGREQIAVLAAAPSVW